MIPMVASQDHASHVEIAENAWSMLAAGAHALSYFFDRFAPSSPIATHSTLMVALMTLGFSKQLGTRFHVSARQVGSGHTQ